MSALRTPLVSKFLLISLILVGLSSISIVKAAKSFYIIGDTGTWGFLEQYSAWAFKKPFVAGDVVVFRYPATVHNTVRVSVSGYDSCVATEAESKKALWTGDDRYSLKKGYNYFICGIGGHCNAGMKIKIFAK
ncbi:hypothetical protein MKW94_030782 [Papaver nudicaule]|uniref:Phytocyanin domain-containing protein n=1 Tax=Papaver nudicaule TaxID=74823 RepID=A0AA41VTI4_PAPNU|nr:hypothetical protein [Papaver nudicaule]